MMSDDVNSKTVHSIVDSAIPTLAPGEAKPVLPWKKAKADTDGGVAAIMAEIGGATGVEATVPDYLREVQELVNKEAASAPQAKEPEAEKVAPVAVQAPPADDYKADLAAMAKSIAQLASMMAPKPEAAPAKQEFAEFVSREDLIRNPAKALVALGLPTDEIETALRLVKEGKEAPRELVEDQKFRDVQDEIRSLKEQMALKERQMEEQQFATKTAYEMSQVLESTNESLPYAHRVVKNNPDFAKKALLASVQSEHSRGNRSFTPADAMVALNDVWGQFLSPLEAKQPPAVDTKPAQAQPQQTEPAPRPSRSWVNPEEAKIRESTREVYAQFLREQAKLK